MSRPATPEELEAQAAFFAVLPRSTFPDGRVIFEEGEEGEEMFIVLSGQVLLYRRTPWGDRVCLGMLGRGQICGELSIFAPGPRITSAIAIGEVRAARVDRNTLLRHLIQRDAYARHLVRACTAVVTRRLRYTRDLSHLLTLYREGIPPEEVDQRLAMLLTASEGSVLLPNARGESA